MTATIQQIIAADAEFMINSGIDVNINTSNCWVEIDDGENEPIFLQGDEAEKFISEAEEIWDVAGTVTIEEVRLHLARPYAENIWN